jgi:copper transport protein
VELTAIVANRSRRGSTGKRVLLLVIVALALVGDTSPAQAHAILEETDPVADTILDSSPDNVTVTFNEPVEVAFGALRVYDTEGERVDVGESSHPGGAPQSVGVGLEPDLPKGTYTVTYRVVSADGHPVEAAFVFHVEEPGERPQGIGETLLSGDGGSGPLEQVLYGLARWALFGGILILVGAFAFIPLVWLRSPASADLDDGVQQRFMGRWRFLVVAAWWLTVLATILGFILQGAVAADVSVLKAMTPSVPGELLETRYGMVAAFRLGILMTLGGMWTIGARAKATRTSWPLRQSSTVGAAAVAGPFPMWLAAVATLLLAFLVATPGLSGHAGATDPVWLNVLTDALHVGAAGLWVGGLVTLIFCAYNSVSQEPATRRVQILGPVVSRFSDVALVAVAVLVVTGAYRTWVEVEALRAFVEAPYGWVLLAKLAIFVPLLGLGAVNNRILKPRIDKMISSGADDGSGLRSLKRVVKAEIALGVVVLAVTALLVNLSPARVEAGITGPFVDEVAMGSNNLNVIVDPNEIGENLVHLTVTTPEGTPTEIKAMKVRFSMPDQNIGPLTGEGRKLAPGHFVVQGRQLSVAGEWVLDIEARIDKFTNEQAEVRLVVNR